MLTLIKITLEDTFAGVLQKKKNSYAHYFHVVFLIRLRKPKNKNARIDNAKVNIS